MTPTRVRADQPTIATLEQTMTDAVYWARRAFTAAGFTNVELVVNVVASSIDPDDDRTTWAAGSRVTATRRGDRQLLAKSLRESATEASA